MNNTVIPANWGIWFHATSQLFDAFDDEERMINLGNDGNSGLGHFLARTVDGAAQYVSHERERGGRADILVVAVLEANQYAASTDEFWCTHEALPDEEEDDPLGLLPPGGMLTRERLMEAGYHSLVIDDIDGTGQVMAMFEAANLKVLKRLSVTQAERMAAWLQETHPHTTEPNALFALMEQWCQEDLQPGKRTFKALKQRYRIPVTAPAPL